MRQLQLYALALAEITRKPVKERYVALLRTGVPCGPRLGPGGRRRFSRG